MSNLHIIFARGSELAVVTQPTKIAVVQGEAKLKEDVEITEFDDFRTIAKIDEDFLLNINEIRIDGEDLGNLDDFIINGFTTDYTSPVVGFNRKLPSDSTLELSYNYIDVDNVNHSINLATDATGFIERNFSLDSGSKVINAIFDDSGSYDITVDNTTDNNINSETIDFEVIRELLVPESSDNSLLVSVTRNKLDTKVQHIHGYEPVSPSELGKEDYLITGPADYQNALDSSKNPEKSNPFVTVDAVIDVLDALGDAVDTKQDLRSVSLNNVEDKELRLVKSKGDIYFYDANSSQGDNNETVLKPNELSSENQGRWITSNQQYSSHGNLNGLQDDDHTQYLNSERHSNEDHSDIVGTIDSGSLGNRPNSQEKDKYWYATDENKFTRDTGSGWETLIDYDYVPSKNEKNALDGSSGQPSSTNQYLTEDEKGTADGIAELDNNQEVPLSQLKTAESDGLATLNGNSNVESSQLSPNYKKHFVEDGDLTSISSGFSNTNYSSVSVTTETDSKTQSIEVQVINQGGSATQFSFRKNGKTIDGPNRVNLATNGSPGDSQIIKVPVNSNQEVEFKVDQNSVDIHLVGYHTTS